VANDRSLTYRDAGVDIDEAERWLAQIRDDVERTRRPGVLSGLGGFAALFSLREAAGPRGLEDPLLVSGTDGVGTKLLVAIQAGRHDAVGIDLVAMCVNDVLTTGAEPLFFLDYFGCGRLEPEIATSVVSGIAEGCRRAGCALVGGETAELPGLYRDGDYDLAGFAVGVVERARLITGDRVRDGDVVLGIASSGLHSNGFSLARKVLLERAGLNLDDPWPEASETEGADAPTVGDHLLTPTRIYADLVRGWRAEVDVRAMAHVTGGGIPGNLPRVLPAGTEARLSRGAWPVPPIFDAIARLGPVEPSEMMRTFNLGLGLVAVVPESDTEVAEAVARRAGERVFRLGHVRRSEEASGEPKVVWED